MPGCSSSLFAERSGLFDGGHARLLFLFHQLTGIVPTDAARVNVFYGVMQANTSIPQSASFAYPELMPPGIILPGNPSGFHARFA